MGSQLVKHLRLGKGGVNMDFRPIMLSIKVACISSLIVMILGTALAWVLNRVNFPGKNAIESLIGLPLVLPPTVIGFGLLLAFGRNAPLGELSKNLFGNYIVFTWWAAVLAAAVVSLPLMFRSVSAAFAGVDTKLEQAARTLGATELRIFLKITLPLALPGIAAGTLLAFARALGEFGATIMIAGNIPGVTQTIPTAIFFAVESGDMKNAGLLVLIISGISFFATYMTNKLSGKQVKSYSSKRDESNVTSSYQKKFA